LELCSVLGVALSGRCAGCAFRGSCPAPRVAVALSRRERQVAVRVAEGLSSKQIAAHLGIALRTVNTYRESLARKLGASSAAVVTRFVLENGLSTSVDDPAV
jgi:DNA-binding NarL/FixJ family response regulator